MNWWIKFNQWLDHKVGLHNRKWAEVSVVLLPASFLGGLLIASALNVTLVWLVLAPTLGFIGGAVLVYWFDRRAQK